MEETKKCYICIAKLKNITMNFKQLSIGALMLWGILPAGAQEDIKLSKESYNKILKMEEQSTKYAKALKETPSNIKAKEVGEFRMNADGMIWSIHMKDTQATYLIICTDSSAPVDSMDKLVDNVYRYYMEQASAKNPIYFFRETVNFQQDSNDRHYTYERRKLLSEKNKIYDEIYELLNTIERPAPPPNIPTILEPEEIVNLIIRLPEVACSPKSSIKENENEERIYDVVETDAQFPGEDEEFMKWLQNNLNYPENCAKNGIKGRVIVSFKVDENGDTKDAFIIRSPNEELSKEAIRIVNAMPKWIPARRGYKTLSSAFTLPINFILP